jgi:TolB-like protein
MQEVSTATRACAKLRASVFGELRLVKADREPVALHNKRATLILAILCLQPEQSINRAALAKLLWPDRFDTQAKASLRQCLLDLRRSLEEIGVAGLEVTRSDVAMAPDVLSSDLNALETALETAPDTGADQLLAIGNQTVLEDIVLNPELAAWLASRREHVDTRLKALITKALDMMGAAQGRALLHAARSRFPGFQVTLPSVGRISMVVLPFAQIDEIGGDFYLADAVRDELTSHIGRVEGVALVGRKSVDVVSNRDLTLVAMASELSVSYLIEGEVRRRPDSIAIRVTLIEGQSGTEAWSDTITGSVEEFIDSRKVIGSNVIASICDALGISQAAPPVRRMTVDREAYTLYLQGRELLHRVGVDGAIERSVELLERSLELDPAFAECWMELADAHINVAAFTPSLERVKHSAEGARCAQRAIELDPNQGHAYSILGVHEWTSFNPSKALDYSLEAYARDPGSSDVASRLGACLLYLGKAREALPYIEAAVERDPIFIRNFAMLVSAHLANGNFDEARQAGERMADLGGVRMYLALAQFALGEYEAAVESHYYNRIFLGNLLMRPPGMPEMDDAARDAYFDFAARGIFSGNDETRSAYCQMLSGLNATMADPYDSSISMPAIWMGHSELVMKMYAECIHPANMFGLMNLWIDIEPIRKTRLHPDFMAFAEKIGMVEAWNRHGWPDLMPSDPRKS